MYHYVESGLENVYLKGVTKYTCQKCKESFVDIPQVTELHMIMSLALASKPTKLTGSEIRFMRKEVGMTGRGFAEAIGVDPVTLSRWENSADDANKSDSHDKLIRYAFLVMMAERLNAIVSNYQEMIKNSKAIAWDRERFEVDPELMKWFPTSSIKRALESTSG
jgi:putative zinc finger/helix-turn-helix YgiT family protein